MEWQKFDTAPKDGTPILTAWVHEVCTEYGVVRWTREEGWTEGSLYVTPGDYWMPLPEAPK